MARAETEQGQGDDMISRGSGMFKSIFNLFTPSKSAEKSKQPQEKTKSPGQKIRIEYKYI
jgi:hypothetical protein